MATKLNASEINALAIAARDGLATGSQDKFTQLYEELYSRKQQYIAGTRAKYPSLTTDDLEALHDDLFLEVLRKYTGTDRNGQPLDFAQALNQALTVRTFSLIPKALARKAMTESLDQAYEEHGDAAHQLANAVTYDESDDSFTSPEAEEAWLNERLDTFGIEGAAARTVAIQRYRNGASYDEIVSVMPHFYRNRQQAHRAVAGQAKWR
jgi:hypothetical protein